MKIVLIWFLVGWTFIFLFAPYMPEGSAVGFGALVAVACAGGVYVTREWKR